MLTRSMDSRPQELLTPTATRHQRPLRLQSKSSNSNSQLRNKSPPMSQPRRRSPPTAGPTTTTTMLLPRTSSRAMATRPQRTAATTTTATTTTTTATATTATLRPSSQATTTMATRPTEIRHIEMLRAQALPVRSGRFSVFYNDMFQTVYYSLNLFLTNTKTNSTSLSPTTASITATSHLFVRAQPN